MGRICSLGEKTANIYISGLNIVEWGPLEDEKLNGRLIYKLVKDKYVLKFEMNVV